MKLPFGPKLGYFWPIFDKTVQKIVSLFALAFGARDFDTVYVGCVLPKTLLSNTELITSKVTLENLTDLGFTLRVLLTLIRILNFF